MRRLLMILNSSLIILKKELCKFISNKRVIFSTLFLPGITIYIVYSTLGYINKKQTDELHISTIYAVNSPQEFNQLLGENKLEFINIENNSVIIEQLIMCIEKQEKKVLIFFPEEFATLAREGCIPNIDFYYNSSVKEDINTYNRIVNVISEYKDQFYKSFTLNNGNIKYDLAKEEDLMGRNFSTILPMLLVSLVFTACLSVSAESIAGEKERHTMLPLLITPIDRKSIVYGKIVALSCLSLVSGLSSFTGMVLALPTMYSFKEAQFFTIYSYAELLLMIVNIISLSILLVASMSIISASANSVKEATTTLSPFGGVAMLVGMTSIMQSDPAQTNLFYCIPVYNNVQVFFELLLHEKSTAHFLITISINLVYTLILCRFLTLIFSSEDMLN